MSQVSNTNSLSMANYLQCQVEEPVVYVRVFRGYFLLLFSNDEILDEFSSNGILQVCVPQFLYIGEREAGVDGGEWNRP